MFDGAMGVATDFCAHDCGRPSWGRLVLKSVVLYVILATACYIECRFRRESIELDASVEIVGGGPKNNRVVRYCFRDPTNGLPRMNTVTVPEHLSPKTTTARIEYIPGVYPTSRLKSSSLPWAPSVFGVVNALFFGGIACVIGSVIWEANHPLPGKRIRSRAGSTMANQTRRDS